jgi:pilus assembly protein CpaB
MGKHKSFILLGVAVLIALVTSSLIYISLKGTMKRQAAPLPTQPVAVAMTDLAWGTVLTKEMIKTVPYLKDNLPQGSFGDPQPLVGRVLIYPVKANEPIFESRLGPITFKTGGVAAVIAPKKRAVSVKVDQVIGVAGFIHAGNRVDVLVTMSPERTQMPVTKIVLENILVLAAGAEVEKKGKEPIPVTVITLEVTPEEAEKLALSATEGKLQLALRSFGDSEDVPTRGITTSVLLASSSTSGFPQEKKIAKPHSPQKRGGGGAKPKTLLAAKKETAPVNPAPEKVLEKPSPEKPPIYIVELIKGSKISEVKFETEGKN